MHIIIVKKPVSLISERSECSHVTK